MFCRLKAEELVRVVFSVPLSAVVAVTSQLERPQLLLITVGQPRLVMRRLEMFPATHHAIVTTGSPPPRLASTMLDSRATGNRL